MGCTKLVVVVGRKKRLCYGNLVFAVVLIIVTRVLISVTGAAENRDSTKNEGLG